MIGATGCSLVRNSSEESKAEVCVSCRLTVTLTFPLSSWHKFGRGLRAAVAQLYRYKPAKRVNEFIKKAVSHFLNSKIGNDVL